MFKWRILAKLEGNNPVPRRLRRHNNLADIFYKIFCAKEDRKEVDMK